ncbi:MAG: F0F1 ATP synthase subunit I [Rhodobacterales bacterium]|nr:MAG: F0F1 ATP synthase subunit I [Rhodobacterales bacterium]
MPETDAERLKALEERIAAAKGPEAQKHHSEEHYSQAQIAWRMVVELVAGLGIGFAIGFGLDALFGTKPFLMVVFIFLGLAAGVKTLMRTAQEVQQIHGPDIGQDMPPKADEDEED